MSLSMLGRLGAILVQSAVSADGGDLHESDGRRWRRPKLVRRVRNADYLRPGTSERRRPRLARRRLLDGSARGGAKFILDSEGRLADFDTWLAELNHEAKRRGYPGAPLSMQCGSECWRVSFEDGMTPAEALDEDEACG